MGHQVMFSKKTLVASVCFLLFFIMKNTLHSATIPLVSYIQPNVDITFLSYSQRINLVKLYIDTNHGKAALITLKPLMRGTQHYQVMLLAAQSYAELERPHESLKYYELARSLATSNKELEITVAGINKMQSWINASIPSSLASAQAVFSTYDQCIKLIKQYVNDNNGKEALKTIKPILMHVISYDIYFLTAQAYAESDNPQRALHYYQLARDLAKSNLEINLATTGISKMKQWLFTNTNKRFVHQRTFETKILAAQAYAENNQPRFALTYYQLALLVAQKPYECTVALFGIAKMQFWLGNYYHALYSYQRILNGPTNAYDFELAKAGVIKSLAYVDRPIQGYRSIPKKLTFTTPNMVIAAAQATLWADQADLTKNILTKYEPITKTIIPNSNLGRDLQDLQWQMELNTNPNVLSPGEFYSEDSEHFSVLHSTLDYSHYWSQKHQSFIGLEQNKYKQQSSTLNAEGVYLRQKWRPTRQLTFNGKIEPTTYQLWSPLLWSANSNYRPNDHLGTQVLAQREVIETFPAFAHHITDYQYAANLLLSPLPYFKVNGSLSRLDVSDGNVRNGYFISATAVISTAIGLNLTLQQRGYTDKFVSPYYFSPNQYSANTAILRIGRKANSVWHYYVDGGLGNQNISVTGNPTATSPTRQIGFGFNGPISKHVILNAYYAMSRQASAFIGSPDYKYQCGAVTLNILL